MSFARLAALLAFSPALAFAQEAPQPPQMPDSNFTQTLFMLGMGLVFFYFVLYRPEQKKRKALDDSKEKMKVGDRVVAVGILGTVYKIEKETVVLKMVDGNKIEVIKAAITEVAPASSSAS
jgi:preprotein translocase subunit YajC